MAWRALHLQRERELCYFSEFDRGKPLQCLILVSSGVECVGVVFVREFGSGGGSVGEVVGALDYCRLRTRWEYSRSVVKGLTLRAVVSTILR